MTPENTQTQKKTTPAKAAPAAEEQVTTPPDDQTPQEEVETTSAEGQYPDDHFTVDQLIESSSTLFGGKYPNFLVSAALHADGGATYSVDQAEKVIEKLANKEVEA